MAFVKTTWVQGAAPYINATQLNRMEQGIADAHAAIGTVTRYDLVNATSVDMTVDSAADRLWVVEFDFSATFNATVLVRPNGSTATCAEVRKESRVLTGPSIQEADGVSQGVAGARILNNLGAGGVNVVTGRLQMNAKSYGNGERTALVDTAYEQSIGSGNNLAGVTRTAYRMAQYGVPITFLRVIADQANALNGSVWLTRR